MRLTLDQIRQITCGAVHVEQGTDGIRFFRLTEPQMEMYAKKKPVFFRKAQLTAGIVLRFRTNSRKLSLRVLMETAGTSDIFCLEVYANNSLIGTITQHDRLREPVEYQGTQYQVSEASAVFDLGSGDKVIAVHMPWSRITHLQEMTLDDDVYIMPIKPKKTLLAFGDSITCGVEAEHPSCRYIARLAATLDAQEFNRAIGGDQFCPEFFDLEEPIVPDYILVSYGTNDWKNAKREDFYSNCRAFFEGLGHRYPDTNIFVITPIWRKDLDSESDFDSIEEVSEFIAQSAACLANGHLIRGWDLVPHDPAFFGDGRLHPNDAGFDRYFENLYPVILTKIN